MTIAISSKGKTLDSQVDDRFGRALYFIVVDTKTMDFRVIENEFADAITGIYAAKSVIDAGATAVLTGNCDPTTTTTLKTCAIKLYTGVSGTVAEAVELFKNGKLQQAEGPSVEAHSGMENIRKSKNCQEEKNMEKRKQKSLVIWVIAAVLVLAAAIGYRVISGGSGPGITQGSETFLVMCDNPDCGAVYEIEKTDYFKQMGANENSTLKDMAAVACLVCRECGEKSAYRALRCPKCGTVFIRCSDPNDVPHRCPKCGHSKTEEKKGPTTKNK
jgi:predicted Fe-Mo cluster-binding NifX family protein/phage FluMu protein Com